jgi:uncharacterized membrane protein
MLVAIGFGVLGIVTVIFSLLFLVVQWAAGTFTPRLTLFRDAPIVWRTFAYAIGVFAFCTSAALGVGRRTEVSLLLPCAALLLSVVAVALVRNLQLRAFASIQLASTLASVATQGSRVLRRLPPDGSPPVPMAGPVTATLTWESPGAVLRELYADRLVEAARAGGGVIVLRQPVGASLLPGTPVADLHGVDISSEAVRHALVAGLERSFDQDPLLAFQLLADIALRALSPAVNDPATAVQALDRIHELLLLASPAAVHGGRLMDAAGEVRVVLALPSWDDYLATALDDVVAARGDSPMVSRRLRTLLGDVSARVLPSQRATVALRLAVLDPTGPTRTVPGIPTPSSRPGPLHGV